MFHGKKRQRAGANRPVRIILDTDRFYRVEYDTATTAAARQRYRVQYEWLRDNWFQGVEYKTGPAPPASFPIAGLQCLPGECSLSGGVFNETAPSPAPAPVDEDDQ